MVIAISSPNTLSPLQKIASLTEDQLAQKLPLNSQINTPQSLHIFDESSSSSYPSVCSIPASSDVNQHSKSCDSHSTSSTSSVSSLSSPISLISSPSSSSHESCCSNSIGFGSECESDIDSESCSVKNDSFPITGYMQSPPPLRRNRTRQLSHSSDRRISFSEEVKFLETFSDEDYDRTSLEISKLTYKDMLELMQVRSEYRKEYEKLTKASAFSTTTSNDSNEVKTATI